MADEPQISILDARLAEIDRRLSTIQTGLADDAGTAPDSAPRLPPKLAVPEPSGGAPHVIAELRGLISDHARLLDAMGELLASGERLLARVAAPRTAAPPPAAPPTAAPTAQVTVTAGPFSSLEAVRDFERDLATLPNVDSVDVRGYEGEDRAMVDVRLSRPNP